MSLETEDLLRGLSQNAESVCRHYLPAGRREGSYWMVGDLQNNPGRSLFVRLTGPTSGPGAAGKFTDSATGEHGDLLDIIRERTGIARFPDLLAEARMHLGRPQPVLPDANSPCSRKSPFGRPAAAARLFAASLPLAGSLAEVYLRTRGVTQAVPSSTLRFHPKCWHRDEGQTKPVPRPALIAAVTDGAGALQGVHRTWLSDLAPMAALVQRAGRLWRHMEMRPQAGRPVPAPVLHVVSPDPNDVPDGRWLNRVLDSGAHVYGAHLQWRTADHLFRVGQIVAPSGLRGLIEAVHGKDAAPVPAALERAEMEGDGKAYAAAALGWQNVVTLEDGYALGGQAQDDTEYPTRLGQPQKVLVLAKRGAGGVEPLFDGAEGWALSEVMANAARLSGLALPDQTAPEVASATAPWPEWKRKQTTVCILGKGGEICEGLRYGADEGLVFVSSQ